MPNDTCRQSVSTGPAVHAYRACDRIAEATYNESLIAYSTQVFPISLQRETAPSNQTACLQQTVHCAQRLAPLCSGSLID